MRHGTCFHHILQKRRFGLAPASDGQQLGSLHGSSGLNRIIDPGFRPRILAFLRNVELDDQSEWDERPSVSQMTPKRNCLKIPNKVTPPFLQLIFQMFDSPGSE